MKWMKHTERCTTSVEFPITPNCLSNITSSDRDPIVHDFPVMDSLPPLEPHSPEMFSRNWVSEAASGDCDRGVTSGQRERRPSPSHRNYQQCRSKQEALPDW